MNAARRRRRKFQLDWKVGEVASVEDEEAGEEHELARIQHENATLKVQLHNLESVVRRHPDVYRREMGEELPRSNVVTGIAEELHAKVTECEDSGIHLIKAEKEIVNLSAKLDFLQHELIKEKKRVERHSQLEEDARLLAGREQLQMEEKELLIDKLKTEVRDLRDICANQKGDIKHLLAKHRYQTETLERKVSQLETTVLVQQDQARELREERQEDAKFGLGMRRRHENQMTELARTLQLTIGRLEDDLEASRGETFAALKEIKGLEHQLAGRVQEIQQRDLQMKHVYQQVEEVGKMQVIASKAQQDTEQRCRAMGEQVQLHDERAENLACSLELTRKELELSRARAIRHKEKNKQQQVANKKLLSQLDIVKKKLERAELHRDVALYKQGKETEGEVGVYVGVGGAAPKRKNTRASSIKTRSKASSAKAAKPHKAPKSVKLKTTLHVAKV